VLSALGDGGVELFVQAITLACLIA